MNRNKEDVRHERIIRGLSKLDDNRKCLNCGSVGPQYVCTTFSTFVCMACGGVHREFSHRVKSISLSKFTPEEVAALQAGGNQRALEMYYKHWDSRHHPVPDSRNPEKLRDFVKAIYVDQLYSADKPPPPRGDEQDGKRSSLRSSFLSSHSFEERRPGLQREAHQRTRSDDRPVSSRDYDGGYSPEVRSMREILGDDLPVLRIEPQRPSTANDSPGAPTSSSQQNTYPENPYPENPEMVQQQPYIKASTTGWATFDTSPEQPANSASWQEMWHPNHETTMWSNTAQGLVFPQISFPPSQFAPETVAAAPRRKSTNPFDLPEDTSLPDFTPSHEFQFQNPMIDSESSSSAQSWQTLPDTSREELTHATRPGNPFA
ncbi:arf-GAP domain and FG repeat-containing protein 2-like isoform X1 [Selaginella moellendorffii]|uniref:arf-GAP domain and FG repeat-containing protein 2-like isoform X1 n=2 Tax=Selaginella moellendorffii TaxID=88036 RepID=UPI000D1CC597|nr:arf-GAP domain and FG repeat-containing protein 2-like isoform X1 [Selaginella moellendorffii]|eukprot:XP_024543879.1 arf-GAP domain and FG repeat-containing protein 2-like isoform X1 [Selaginella moellendorffii]